MPVQTDRRVDPEFSAVQPLPARRWWIVPALALSALLLLAVLTAAVIALRLRQQHHAAAAAVRAEVRRIQAAGEPITTEDLYAYHRAPPGAADITKQWLDAIQSFTEQQFIADSKALPMVGEGPQELLRPAAPSSQLAAAEAFLAKYDQTLLATLAAARLEGECRFPTQFEKGIATLLHHPQRLRYVSRLLALNGRVRVLAGDTDGALESLEAMFATSDTLEHQMFLIEHLVRIAILNSALEEAEWLLNETPLTDEQLARIEARLEPLDLQDGLTNGLVGERAMLYDLFHHLPMLANEQVAQGVKLPAIALGRDGQLGRPADCLKMLELLGQTIEASREPFPEASRKVEQVNDRLRAIAGSRNPLDKMQYLVTILMTPAVGSGFEATARGQARRDALLAAIAAERHRLKTGSFSAKLADLVPAYLPAVPIDPFDGQPLRMIAGEGELTIYSVGQNEKDDGGVATTTGRDGDIVVRVRAQKGPQPETP